MQEVFVIDSAMYDYFHVGIVRNELYCREKNSLMIAHEIVAIVISPERPGFVPEANGQRQRAMSQVKSES
jgi:hypothetical protein